MPMKKKLDKINLSETLDKLKITKNEARKILGRSRPTIDRWERIGAPAHILPLLEIATGHLDHHGPAWRGWRIKNGELHAPQLYHPFEPHHIYLLHWEIQSCKEAQKRAWAEETRRNVSRLRKRA